MTDGRCEHCPCDPGSRCPAFDAPRLCVLVRPGGPRAVAYRESVRAHARPPGPEDPTFEQLEAQRIAYESLPPEERRRCCGS